jgi:hypothetical protein
MCKANNIKKAKSELTMHSTYAVTAVAAVAAAPAAITAAPAVVAATAAVADRLHFFDSSAVSGDC